MKLCVKAEIIHKKRSAKEQENDQILTNIMIYIRYVPSIFTCSPALRVTMVLESAAALGLKAPL